MKLSPYTIAKNCTDLADVECGIAELKPAIMAFEKLGKSYKKGGKIIFIRYAKLLNKRDQLLQISNSVK